MRITRLNGKQWFFVTVQYFDRNENQFYRKVLTAKSYEMLSDKIEKYALEGVTIINIKPFHDLRMA